MAVTTQKNEHFEFYFSKRKHGYSFIRDTVSQINKKHSSDISIDNTTEAW